MQVVSIPAPSGLAKNGAGIGHAQFEFDDAGNVLSVSNAGVSKLDSTVTDAAVWSSTLQYQTEVETALATSVIGFTNSTLYADDFTLRGSAEDTGGCRWADCSAGRLVTDALLHSCPDCNFGRCQSFWL